MANKLGEYKGIPIINGDIFDSGADIIVHQVNCQGVMGSGVAKQVRERFPRVYNKYVNVCRESNPLGDILLVCADETDNSKPIIANLFAQYKYGYDGGCYTDYNALQKCLDKLNICAKGMTVAIPYMMSCYRGGGDWEIVSTMIFNALKDCDVTFYRYNKG